MAKGKAGGILALLSGGAEEEGDEEVDAAQDLLTAIKDNDAKAVNLALKRHYELCASSGGDEDDEDEEL